MDPTKTDIAHQERVADHDLIGDAKITREEAMHFGKLTEEELVIEKKLRRKMDIRIMPLVILVYLMSAKLAFSAHHGCR